MLPAGHRAGEGLPSSRRHHRCVPRPIRGGVPHGCASRLFAALTTPPASGHARPVPGGGLTHPGRVPQEDERRVLVIEPPFPVLAVHDLGFLRVQGQPHLGHPLPERAHRRQLALGNQANRGDHPPAGRRARLTLTKPPCAGKDSPRACATPPTRCGNRAVRHGRTLKTAGRRSLKPAHQDHERSRLASPGYSCAQQSRR